MKMFAPFRARQCQLARGGVGRALRSRRGGDAQIISSPSSNLKCSRRLARPLKRTEGARSLREVMHRGPLFYCSNCSSVPELKTKQYKQGSGFAGGKISGAGDKISRPGGKISAAGGGFSERSTRLCGGQNQRSGGRIQPTIGEVCVVRIAHI